VLGATVKLPVVALAPVVVLALAAELALYTYVEAMAEPHVLVEAELLESPL
jgi:hypothetical protein